MGITGLLPFLEKSCRRASIKDFKGSTVAIDAYCWLHKGAFSCAEKLVKGEKTDGYVLYCLKLLNMILDAGLRPIMIFDGCHLPSKEFTEKKRRENRKKTRQRGKELLCEGKLKEARECFQRAVDVTPDMAREVIEACRRKSVNCIVAPYEADAQLAYLDKIGMAQLIITEDSDLILFGCNKVFFKMDACGTGLVYEKENLSKSFGNRALKFSFEKFRYMCILSGCDYLPSLHGIGLAKAFKFFSLTSNTDLNSVLPKLPSYLKMPKLEVSSSYIESFMESNNTFLYQLVFCPQKKCLVPLNPYPDDVNPEDMHYAGKYLPEDLACQLAMGDINVNTMEIFDVSPDHCPTINTGKSFVWSSGDSSCSTKPTSKPQVNGFKFSSSDKKAAAPIKRPFTEMAKTGMEASLTDEDLFSMYSSQAPKGSRTQKECLEEEPIFEEDHNSSAKEYKKEKSPEKIHPKRLNTFKKVVRSRFFSSGNMPKKSMNSSEASMYSLKSADKSSISCDIEKTKKSTDLSESSSLDEHKLEVGENFDSAPMKDSQSSSDSAFSESGCEFNVDLPELTPKEDSKFNIVHRFAKKRATPKKSPPGDSSKDISSTPSKSELWIDIIDEECNASTSTISSNGKASKLLDTSTEESPKPVFLNNPLKRTPTSKKLSLKKLQDFKWTREPKKARLSDNRQNESFDASQEVSPSPSSQVSGYFSLPSSGVSFCDSAIDLVSDSEDGNDSFSAKDSSNNQVSNKSVSSQGGLKSFKSSNNKAGKSGKCRTLGLSKNRKSSEKVSKKETLMNFNFIRQPKKETSVL